MFDLTGSYDFYTMVVEDFDDFMAEPHSARRALHCAITAYHLREWVWSDWLESDWEVQKALGISDEATFNTWVNRECVSFRSIRELANGTKHLRMERGFETKRVMAAPFAVDQLGAGFDQGTLDSPTPFLDSCPPSGPGGKGRLLIDYGLDASIRWRTAASLLEAVVRFWRDFFKRYRPLPNLLVSRHHVD